MAAVEWDLTAGWLLKGKEKKAEGVKADLQEEGEPVREVVRVKAVARAVQSVAR